MSEETQEEINLAEVATAEQANVAINEAQEDITEIGDNDVLITPNVDLPTRDDTTITRVMQVLKQNFDNFSFDVNEDYAKKFNNLDDLISYTDRSFGDICKEREKTECFVRNRDGAAMARFWCACKVLSDVALSGKKYGDQAVKQYAAHRGISDSYLYQQINIARRLDIVDVFLLGTRGIETLYLRKLAGFKDDVTRQTIINSFLERYTSTVNKKDRDLAKKAFISAINASGKNTKNIDAANPIVALASSEDFVPTPETEGVLAAVGSVSGMLKKLSRPEIMHDLEQYGDNFFMLDNTPDAEKQLAKVKEKATELRDLCEKSKDNLEFALQKLDSLLAVQLLPHEQ
jgi:hypothetical protein